MALPLLHKLLALSILPLVYGQLANRTVPISDETAIRKSGSGWRSDAVPGAPGGGQCGQWTRTIGDSATFTRITKFAGHSKDDLHRRRNAPDDIVKLIVIFNYDRYCIHPPLNKQYVVRESHCVHISLYKQYDCESYGVHFPFYEQYDRYCVYLLLNKQYDRECHGVHLFLYEQRDSESHCVHLPHYKQYNREPYDVHLPLCRQYNHESHYKRDSATFKSTSSTTESPTAIAIAVISSKGNAEAIGGGVAGGFVAIVLLVLAFLKAHKLHYVISSLAVWNGEHFEDLTAIEEGGMFVQNKAEESTSMVLGTYEETGTVPFRPFLQIKDVGTSYPANTNLYLHIFVTNGYRGGQYAPDLISKFQADRLTPSKGIKVADLYPVSHWQIRKVNRKIQLKFKGGIEKEDSEA
ncbi:hypothetical protein NLJ89_g1804 [Agrocybe chaxingu]|uniref:Uncharacterized protein n=1 Tax=Agrocybe chaxingu TaxID=84603 RepID=A0A9W8TEJ2_9AGAR|nr:hypothetical protein NLJ89_g1804 [Agrocybe chaxingu]